MKKQKQGFTLVELIVVITILAILGTIAIMAFGGYSKNARDSRRISDLNNITKTLELYKLEKGNYPDPTDTFAVTYSGATAWTQGNFGDTTVTNVGKLDKKPTDPLTGNEYTYSVTNTKAEFQVAAIYEGDNLRSGIITQANAAEELKTVVRGTYNGKFVKTQSGTTTYILGAPSIITSEITSVDIETILTNKSFVYSNYKNLPSSYKTTSYTLTGGFDFGGGTGVVLFEGNLSNLGTSTGKLDFASKLNAYYGAAPLDTSVDYKEIVEVDTVGNSAGAVELINTYISSKLPGLNGVAQSSTSGLGGGEGGGSGVCGKDTNKHLYATPTNLCDSGTPSSVIDAGILGDYTWTCGTTSCSGRHAFDWDYNPADIRDILGNYSIYTENWSTNTCDPDIITVIDVNPGTNVVPNTIPANTIYRLSAGNYTNTTTVISGPWSDTQTSIKVGECSGVIGVGNVNFYTSAGVGAFVYLSGKSIFSGIKLEGLKDSGGINHTRTGKGIGFLGDNITVHSVDIANFSSANDYPWTYLTLHNINTYNNTSHGLNLDGSSNGYFYNINTFNNGGRGIYLDGSSNNFFSNIKAYNNNNVGIRFAYETNSSINNIISFNNANHGVWGESYENTVNNIYNYNNGGSGFDTDWVSPFLFANNIFTYNNTLNGTRIDGSEEGAALLFGVIKSFGNMGTNHLLTNYSFGSGSNLGFLDGTSLDTASTFDSTWVVTPSTSGWNINTKGRQSLTFTDGTTYTYGSNIGNQKQPIIYNTNTPELWGVDGVHFDSSKKVGQW